MSSRREEAEALLRECIAIDAIVPWTDYGDRDKRARTLPRYAAAGFTLAGLSLCSDAESTERLLKALARTRREIAGNPDALLIRGVDDVRRAKRDGKLALSFNCQGSANLGGDLNLVQLWYDLGVRQMILVYNHKNAVGDGCHERTDGGLSRYGIELVAEMNRVGMLVDCTHVGYRTSMDAIEHSADPVLFSHSNPKRLWAHDRNITDDQAIACATRGGWIGACGVGIFMGDDDASTEQLFRQVDYWANLVGPEHVGLGSDYVYDPDDMQRYMRSVKSPPGGRYDEMTQFVQPEQLVELVERMIAAGYGTTAIAGILGENYLRVAGRVWR